MAIHRKNLFNKLSIWRGQSDRKPLLLRGARQVGKSWGVKLWCESLNLKLITINFEERPQYAEIFEQDLDVDRIINEISLITSSSPRSENTVLFFDEIQKAPKAILALRYFYEKAPDVMVLAAGSLVEFVIEECGLPVGRVESLFIYPLTFSEFLEATGDRSLSEFIDSFDYDKDEAPSALVHEKLVVKLRLYYRIGGMPKVVSRYIETRDLKAVAEEQAIIVQGYRDDFRKYARKADWVLLENIFSKMGDLAGGPRIKFSLVSKEHKSTQVRRALLALERALIIHKILSSTAKSPPLAAHAVDSRFKISFLDIGLLHYILGFDWSRISFDAELTNIADGRFAEQFVAQELLASRSKHSMYRLHYWSRNVAGSESEVDFLVEVNNQIAPLEVKSGQRGKLKSLSIYCRDNHPERVFILSQRNFERVAETLYIPLYFASRLR
jgi:predicted AAA+ superfamily ATPase